jgi:hypothetical protein
MVRRLRSGAMAAAIVRWLHSGAMVVVIARLSRSSLRIDPCHLWPQAMEEGDLASLGRVRTDFRLQFCGGIRSRRARSHISRQLQHPCSCSRESLCGFLEARAFSFLAPVIVPHAPGKVAEAMRRPADQPAAVVLPRPGEGNLGPRGTADLLRCPAYSFPTSSHSCVLPTSRPWY